MVKNIEHVPSPWKPAASHELGCQKASKPCTTLTPIPAGVSPKLLEHNRHRTQRRKHG